MLFPGYRAGMLCIWRICEVIPVTTEPVVFYLRVLHM